MMQGVFFPAVISRFGILFDQNCMNIMLMKSHFQDAPKWQWMKLLMREKTSWDFRIGTVPS